MDEKPRDNSYKKWHDYWLNQKEKTQVLFIAESPPPYSKYNNYFYYTGDDSSYEGFNKFFISPLEKNIDNYPVSSGKKNKIKNFIKYGYWLEDLFQKPMDCMQIKEIKERSKKLSELIKSLDPKNIVMMLPKKIFNHYSMELLCSELAIDYDLKSDDFNLIELQEKLLSNLITGNIESKITIFPGRGIASEWREKDVTSFSKWVSNHKENGDIIKEWLEIDGE